ncbi:DNA primase [Deferribacter autotrophicus]|uniref:DNA primase n=1 Tax=Deferribacter autotrophicus TaxID=500465 RepID=A0A5A8F858_9BACT|nr:DNA primase [Deferribacter autotrophicus]KAA0259428.1 DNA primase [Deferribacter autotrophicus]
MKISESSISTILEQANILDLISEYVELKKTGKNYRGLCPFHSEKTPSFYVSEEKGVFHCFGCGASGNAISFVMKYHGYDFIDAVKFLAEKYGINIEMGEIKPYVNELYSLHEEIGVLAKKEILLSKDKRVKEFLQKRKLSLDLIDEFDIGFIGDGINLETVLKKYDRDVIIKSGLFYERYGSYSFKLRNRILFSIHSLTGKTIAFSGRVLDDSLPKYINSPETDIFSKRKILYNLNRAKNYTEGEVRKIYVVEGYFDVIRMWEYGFRNCVSTMGTSLTEEHAAILKRYADEVVLLFDGDEAGRKAAIRSLDVFLKNSFVPNVLFLPKGEDPDTFLLKNGSDALINLEKNKKDLFKLFINKVAKRCKDNYNLKSKYLADLSKKVSLIRDNYLKEIYLKEISDIFHIDYDSLKKGVDFSLAKKILNRSERKVKYICEYDFISSLFSLPEDVLLELINDINEDYFFDENMKKIYKKVVEFLNKNVNISVLVNDPEVGDFLSELLLKEQNYEDDYYSALLNKYKICINYLKKIKKEKQQLLGKSKDNHEKMKILSEINDIINKQKEYEKRLLEVQSL